MPRKGNRHPARPAAAPRPSAAEATPASAPSLSADPLETPPSSPAPGEAESAVAPHTPSSMLSEALGEVLAQSARHEAIAVAPPPPPARAPSAWIAAALASWIVALGLLLLEPSIAAGPVARPWSPASGASEASLRYGLWLARQRVLRFEAANGRLPSFLAEAGVRDSTLHLAVHGERAFSLEGREGAVTLQLDRAMDADSFLGTSLEALGRR